MPPSPGAGVEWDSVMSFNRFEQTVFDYWGRNPDELRHWQAKTMEVARRLVDPSAASRALERELWDYFRERAEQVPVFRALKDGTVGRFSLLNLAEYAIRLWGPPPPRKKNPER